MLWARPRVLRWGGPGAVILAAGGCAEVLGIEDWQGPANGGGGAAPDACVVCVDAAPQGWEGPVAFLATDMKFDECPAPWQPGDLTGGTEADSVEVACSACECATSDTSCTAGVVSLYQAPDCMGTETQFIPTPMCGPIPGISDISQYVSVRASPSTQGNLMCTVVGGGAVIEPRPAPAWATQARTCLPQPVPGACNSAQVCVPATPEGHRLCVLRAGEAEQCPGGSYVDRILVYTYLQDNRSCTPCACRTTGFCDDSATSTFSPAVGGCPASRLIQQIPNDGECHVLEDDGFQTLQAKLTADPTGSCAADSGQPAGEVVPDKRTAHTLCCAL